MWISRAPAVRAAATASRVEAHGRARGARSGDAWRLHRGGVAPDGHLWGAGSLVHATRDPRGTAPVHAPDRSRLEPVVVRVRGQRGDRRRRGARSTVAGIPRVQRDERRAARTDATRVLRGV